MAKFPLRTGNFILCEENGKGEDGRKGREDGRTRIKFRVRRERKITGRRM